MDHQAQMSANGAAKSPARAVARSMGELCHDLLTLTELQARLLAVELGASARQIRLPLLVLVAGCVLGVASLPVVLAWFALFLMEVAGMTAAAAFGITALAAIIISAILIAGGWWRFPLLFFGHSSLLLTHRGDYISWTIRSKPR